MDKLETDFLGLHLGCSLKELEALLEKSPSPMRQFKKDVSGQTTSYYYSGNHRLNGATGTVFMFWHDKLYTVIVVFQTEEGGSVYEALKTKLAKKYGEVTGGANSAAKACALTKDGMDFVLTCETNPSKGDFVQLMAVHAALAEAKKVGDVQRSVRNLGDL